MCKRRTHSTKLSPSSGDIAHDAIAQLAQRKLGRIGEGRPDGVPLLTRPFSGRRASVGRVLRRPRGFVNPGLYGGCVWGARLFRLREKLPRSYSPIPGAVSRCPRRHSRPQCPGAWRRCQLPSRIRAWPWSRLVAFRSRGFFERCAPMPDAPGERFVQWLALGCRSILNFFAATIS